NRQSEGPWFPQVVTIPEGIATLGLGTSSAQFGWDNEFQEHPVDVPSFRIDRYKVSNGQYLAFIEDQGYARPKLWSEEDWAWREREQITHPKFWVQTYHGWQYRTI